MFCIEPDFCPGGGPLCQRCITTDTPLEEGEWYHIVCTYDGGSQKIYLNNELVSEESYFTPTGISTRPYPMTIGTDIYDNNPIFLEGTLDEIIVYNSAFTESQVEVLFQDGVPLSSKETVPESEVLLFPNPANDQVNLEAPFSIEVIEIYDLTGKLVQTKRGIDLNQININGFANGIYTIFLYNSDQLSQKKLFVSQ